MSHTVRGWLLVLALASVPTAGFAASPQIQSSRQFHVPYKVPKSGAIAKIQLWMTADDGANWSLYRTDEKLSGKIPVEVQKDGRYGFFLVGELKDGRHGKLPTKNTTPQRIYLVDTQPPQLAFEAPAADLSVLPGALVEIRWRASDANLKARGVSLLYAINTMKGKRGKMEYKSIAKNLNPAGGFNWKVPGPVGASYRIRGVAEDEAGWRTEVDHTAEITVVDAKALLAARFGKVRKLVDEGKFDPALKELKTFAEPDRNDARHAFLQGLALSGLKRHDEALPKFQEAVKRNKRGKHVERAYLELGKIHFRRALKPPKQAGPSHKQEELEKARDYFEKSIAIRDADTAEEYCLAGVTCYKLWDIGRADSKLLDQARKHLAQATGKAAGSPLHAGNAHWYLAKIREFQKKYDKARDHWQKAAEHFAKATGYESFQRAAKQRANYLRKNNKYK